MLQLLLLLLLLLAKVGWHLVAVDRRHWALEARRGQLDFCRTLGSCGQQQQQQKQQRGTRVARGREGERGMGGAVAGGGVSERTEEVGASVLLSTWPRLICRQGHWSASETETEAETERDGERRDCRHCDLA